MINTDKKIKTSPKKGFPKHYKAFFNTLPEDFFHNVFKKINTKKTIGERGLSEHLNILSWKSHRKWRNAKSSENRNRKRKIDRELSAPPHIFDVYV